MTETDPVFAALARRFPLVTVPLVVAGRAFDLLCVRDQDTLLAGITDEAEVDRFPFGLLLWASAIALAESLAASPEVVTGKRVLEIGAGGVGLPGLVAAHLGAAHVTQTDYHAESLTLLAHNARTNGFAGRVTQVRGDWRDFAGVGQPFDVVLGSDILYEHALHDALLTLLPKLVVPGGLLLLSDPLRPQALTFIERLEAQDDYWRLPVKMTGHTVTEPDGTMRQTAQFALRRRFIAPPSP